LWHNIKEITSYIARLVNEGLLAILDGGRIRSVPVKIIGSSYASPIPFEDKVKQDIRDLLDADLEDIDKAIFEKLLGEILVSKNFYNPYI